MRRCVDALGDGVDGAIAAAPVTDTIKHTDGAGRVVSTLERSALWAVQTPQVFRADALRRALDVDPQSLAGATDDASLVEAAGGRVEVVESRTENFKVTTPLDLRMAEAVLARPMLTDYHVHLRPDEYDATAARYFTAENAERYRAAAAERGIGELGISEHIHRFTACPGRVGPRVVAAQRQGRHRRVLRVPPGTRTCAWESRPTSCAGARSRPPRCWTPASGTTWSDRCTSCRIRRVDMRGSGVGHLGVGRPRRGVDALLRDAGPRRRDRAVRHPGPPRPGQGLGQGGAPARGRPPPLLRAGHARESRPPTSPSRSPQPGCASRWARSTPTPSFLRMCLDAGKPVALSSDAHMPEDLGHGYDAAVAFLREHGVTELADLHRAASAPWSRWDERPHRHRLRLAPPGRVAAAGARRRRMPRTPSAG